jgi:hypothetical protein
MYRTSGHINEINYTILDLVFELRIQNDSIQTDGGGMAVRSVAPIGAFKLSSLVPGKGSTFMASSEHVELMPTWPHIGVRPHGRQPGLLPKITPYVKYTSEDLAMLEADVEKRQLSIERYTDCIVPCLLDFGKLLRTKRHLLEDTGSIFGFLQMIFAAQAPTIN